MILDLNNKIIRINNQKKNKNLLAGKDIDTKTL
jgi:hypothetical protein